MERKNTNMETQFMQLPMEMIESLDSSEILLIRGGGVPPEMENTGNGCHCKPNNSGTGCHC